MKQDQISNIHRLLALEELSSAAATRTPEIEELIANRGKLLKQIREIGKSDDLALIVTTEKIIVRGDLERYANSKGMISSLGTATVELDAAEKLLAMVDDKQEYSRVDASHSLPKNRDKGLPLDEARQAFKSHYARLNNLDKSRLSDDEKAIIDARKSNIFNAGKLYALRQAKTLCVELKPGRWV